MRFGTGRHIRDQPCHPLHFGNSEMCLPKPERAKWYYEYAYPFQAVPCPAGKESTERYASRSAGESQRLTRRTLADRPDKSGAIKVHKRGSGYDACEDAFDHL